MPVQERFSISSLTYEEIVSEFESVVAQLRPDWNFADLNDPFRIMIEGMAAMTARSIYIINTWVLESNIITAREWDSVVGHARRLGYPIGTLQPGIVDLQLTAHSGTAGQTAAPYTVRASSTGSGSSSGIIYENEESIVVPSGTGDPIFYVRFVEGETFTETFTSTGKPSQRIRLSRAPVLKEVIAARSLLVTVGGSTWTEVDGFHATGVLDQHYFTTIDADGIMDIYFGDGVTGEIPVSGASIVVRYRIGKGTTGSVKAGTLRNIANAPAFLKSINNPSDSYGAADNESIEHVRIFAPLMVTDGGQLNRMETIANYADGITGVGRSTAVLNGTAVNIYILVSDGFTFGAISSIVQAGIDERIVMGFIPVVSPAQLVEANLDVVVYALSNYNINDIEAAVRDKLDVTLNPFSTDASGKYIRQFGQGLRRSDIGLALREIPGVYDYEIIDPSANLSLLPNQIHTNTHNQSSVTVTVLGGTTGPTTA